MPSLNKGEVYKKRKVHVGMLKLGLWSEETWISGVYLARSIIPSFANEIITFRSENGFLIIVAPRVYPFSFKDTKVVLPCD